MKTFKQYLNENLKSVKYQPTGWGLYKPGKPLTYFPKLKLEQVILLDVSQNYGIFDGVSSQTSWLLAGKHVLMYAGDWWGHRAPPGHLPKTEPMFNVVHPVTLRNISKISINLVMSTKFDFYFPK